MQPIAKFTFETYVEEEDKLVEYIVSIADEYAPRYDFDGQQMSNAPDMFKVRYNSGEIFKNTRFSFKDYVSNEDIQNTIKALNLDPEKFWYLLLFICDYCVGHCLEGQILQKFPKEELKNLITAFKDNANADCEIVMNMKNKKVAVIKNPTAIKFLINTCEDAINQITDPFYLNIRKPNFEGKNLPDTALITLFTDMINSFFEINPQFKGKRTVGNTVSINKRLFISRLIDMTKIFGKPKFRGDDDLLSGYLKYPKDKLKKQRNKYY
ncbi:MAG: hypothetical protein LBN27_03895 [Prevotellaceae bacterium]|jgi:hypothetical protein|nr:hypothetical protein [Prevotellaceae bacterium]